MYRGLLGWAAVVWLAVAAGCSMCGHPYDYCGPTFTGPQCGGDCMIDTRAGSILAPAGAVMGPAGVVPGEVISEAVGPETVISTGDGAVSARPSGRR